MGRIIEKQLSFAELSIQVDYIGEDYHIIIRGGDRHHIGCTVLAVPRLSLTGDGSISVTSSVINVTGHKDEVICRRLAEKVARRKNAITVCTGGFHIDHICKEQIDEVIQAVDDLEIMI